MSNNFQSLPPEIELAVEANKGAPVFVSGMRGRYMVMDANLFGGAIPSADEFADSVAGVRASLEQAANGQARDADQALDELDQRYGG